MPIFPVTATSLSLSVAILSLTAATLNNHAPTCWMVAHYHVRVTAPPVDHATTTCLLLLPCPSRVHVALLPTDAPFFLGVSSPVSIRRRLPSLIARPHLRLIVFWVRQCPPLPVHADRPHHLIVPTHLLLRTGGGRSLPHLPFRFSRIRLIISRVRPCPPLPVHAGTRQRTGVLFPFPSYPPLPFLTPRMRKSSPHTLAISTSPPTNLCQQPHF